MSGLDLTEAVEAAARAAAEHRAFVGNARPSDGMSMWDSLRPEVQHLLRELALPLVAAAFATLTPERRATFHGHGFVDQAAERLVTPWVEIPDEVLSDEAIQMLRDRLMKVRADRAEDPS